MKDLSTNLKVSLTIDKDGIVDGYTIEHLNKSNISDNDNEVLERIRDMHYWSEVKYDGRESTKRKADQTFKLKFKSPLYHNNKTH